LNIDETAEGRLVVDSAEIKKNKKHKQTNEKTLKKNTKKWSSVYTKRAN
jgi:hypothetical protein